MIAAVVVAAPGASSSDAGPLYACTVCGAPWSYRAVRHVARCRDCGGGLRRLEESAAPARRQAVRGSVGALDAGPRAAPVVAGEVADGGDVDETTGSPR
jgi:DNA-directed RNA polymerase subunit RPC12/RpoP